MRDPDIVFMFHELPAVLASFLTIQFSVRMASHVRKIHSNRDAGNHRGTIPR